jgi:hypothetical protein
MEMNLEAGLLGVSREEPSGFRTGEAAADDVDLF